MFGDIFKGCYSIIKKLLERNVIISLNRETKYNIIRFRRRIYRIIDIR